VKVIFEAPDEDKAPKGMGILEVEFYDNAVLLLPEKYRQRFL